MPELPTYSFGDVYGSITGPGGTVAFGNGNGTAEEGIEFEPTGEMNKMLMGTGGQGMHSLTMDDSGRARIHCMKNSPINAQLDQLYKYQKTSSAFWGQNVITMTNPVSGDQYTCTGTAFTKRPTNTFAKDANILTWEFDVIRMVATLG